MDAKSLPVLLIAITILTSCQESEPFAQLRGDLQAQTDITQGKLRLLQWGLIQRFDFSDTYEGLLKSRYGIEIKTVAGCVATSNQAAYWDAYYAVMHEAICRRYGPGVFERTMADAESTVPAHVAVVD